MKLLLTGATGFIGRQLVPALTGQQLTIVTRDIDAAMRILGAEHHFISSLETLDNLDGYDGIINLAGEPIIGKRWNEAQKTRLCHSRWDITSRLATLIKHSKTPPAVFVSGSAVGYYGAMGDELLTESSPPQPCFTHQLCDTWEQLALAATSEHTRVCVLRTGLVLGLGGGALAKMLLPFRLGLGGPMGSGTQGMSWIHLEDMIDLILFLLRTDTCQGIFNATAPHPVSNAAFARALGKALHRPSRLTAPAIALQLLLGEAATMVLDGQYVLPGRALQAGFTFRHPELDQALATLF